VARRSPAELKEMIRDFRREQIIDVASRLFGDRGTTEVPMEEVASEAGVARSTIYVYFSSRDELLRACLKQMYILMQEDLAGAFEREASPTERLRAVIRSLLERLDDNAAFFRVAMATQGSAANGAAALDAEFAQIGLHMAGILEDLVRLGVGEGVFRPFDPARAAALIGQQVFGAMQVRAGDPAPLPLEVAVDEVCDFVLHGLAVRPTG
jgi:TetR/AcrR family fatty acid metabolism transcriptional regulator